MHVNSISTTSDNAEYPPTSWLNILHHSMTPTYAPYALKNAPQRTLPKPQKLTLRFSRAADILKAADIFSDTRRIQIDPKGYVRARSIKELYKPVASGSAVLALDENEKVRCFAMLSYHQNRKAGHGFTEIGAIMCDVKGIGLAQTAIAMLSLKQLFSASTETEAQNPVFARVAPDNFYSHKVFASSLNWNEVTNKATRDNLLGTLTANDVPVLEGRKWYSLSLANAWQSASLVNACLQTQSLRNKNGQAVPVTIEAPHPKPQPLGTEQLVLNAAVG